MFEATSSFKSSLDRAVGLFSPSVLRVDGCGSISVYPQQNCYVTDIHDWESVFSSGSGQFQVSPMLWVVPPEGALPLSELHWRAAYRHVSDQLVSSESVTRELVQLVSWPNLSRLPEELVVPVTRICALLWRKPTVGFLVPRVLDAPGLETAVLLEVLQGFGHVASVRTLPERPEIAQNETAAGTPVLPVRAGSLLGKLWQRLTGHSR